MTLVLLAMLITSLGLNAYLYIEWGYAIAIARRLIDSDDAEVES